MSELNDMRSGVFAASADAFEEDINRLMANEKAERERLKEIASRAMLKVDNVKGVFVYDYVRDGYVHVESLDGIATRLGQRCGPIPVETHYPGKKEGELGPPKAFQHLFDCCGRDVAEVVYGTQPATTHVYDPEKNLLTVNPLPQKARMSAIRPDGSVFVGPGFDPVCGIIVEDSTDTLFLRGAIGDPSPQQVLEAKATLDELVGDFPFESPADRGGALAYLITCALRSTVDAPSPLFFMRASVAGTGKNTLVQMGAHILEGRKCPGTTWKGDRETEKTVVGHIQRGWRMIFLDEIEGDFHSRWLCGFLAEDLYGPRLLGGNATLQMKNRFVQTAAGNNVRLSTADIIRRTVQIRMRAKQERPETRSDFKFVDEEGMFQHVAENRGKIIEACLVLMASWRQAGAPAPGGRMNGFSTWYKRIGGIIVHHWGAALNPVLTWEKAREDQAMTEAGGLPRLIGLLWRNIRETEWRVSQLLQNDQHNPVKKPAARNALLEVVGEIIGRSALDPSATISLGAALKKLGDHMVTVDASEKGDGSARQQVKLTRRELDGCNVYKVNPVGPVQTVDNVS